MDCKQMLQSTFDWANKGKVSGSVEFPDIATVYATVTLHHTLDRTEKTSDLVYYANGSLLLSNKDGQEVLTGNIPAWINKIESKSVPNDGFGHTEYDLFPDNNKLGLLLTITQTGLLTVGKLINGKLIGGMPPTTFQPTCQNGLLTAIVSIAGECVCTVSFSLGTKVLG